MLRSLGLAAAAVTLLVVAAALSPVEQQYAARPAAEGLVEEHLQQEVARLRLLLEKQQLAAVQQSELLEDLRKQLSTVSHNCEVQPALQPLAALSTVSLSGVTVASDAKSADVQASIIAAEERSLAQVCFTEKKDVVVP